MGVPGPGTGPEKVTNGPESVPGYEVRFGAWRRRSPLPGAAGGPASEIRLRVLFSSLGWGRVGGSGGYSPPWVATRGESPGTNRAPPLLRGSFRCGAGYLPAAPLR